MTDSTNQAQRFGPAAFLAFGLLLFVLGIGRVASHAAFDRWGERVIGVITEVRSGVAPDDPSYVGFRFTDPSGVEREGGSNGYRGVVGETILVEYLSVWPGWNRVAGAGRRTVGWSWLVAGGGAFFAFIGTHWAVAVRRRRRLVQSLAKRGERTGGTVTRLASNVVHYEFSGVDAKSVKGRTLGMPFPGLDELQEGASVEVLFDPRDPRRNVLAGEVAQAA